MIEVEVTARINKTLCEVAGDVLDKETVEQAIMDTAIFLYLLCRIHEMDKDGMKSFLDAAVEWVDKIKVEEKHKQ